LVLNALLSFAQFGREIVGERNRDKIAATRRKGKWAAAYEANALRDRGFRTQSDPEDNLSMDGRHIRLQEVLARARGGSTRTGRRSPPQ
jgi:hypothetical protein